MSRETAEGLKFHRIVLGPRDLCDPNATLNPHIVIDIPLGTDEQFEPGTYRTADGAQVFWETFDGTTCTTGDVLDEAEVSVVTHGETQGVTVRGRWQKSDAELLLEDLQSFTDSGACPMTLKMVDCIDHGQLHDD